MADTVGIAVPSRALVLVRSDEQPHVSSGWFGMWWLIAAEAALFAYLLFSYFYSMLASQEPWPPDGPPSLTLALPNTGILILSSVAAWWGERAAVRCQWSRAALGLVFATILGTAFIAVQLVEWHNKPFSLTTHLYGSLYFTITGFHMAHVVVGLIVLGALAWWSFAGDLDRQRREPISIGAIYWHFVDVVWLVVFTTFYIAPYVR
jgi:heme/copper-type cytochrome/quinol oxidase subunit 3